jgi:curved DNA-binding protein CbpA
VTTLYEELGVDKNASPDEIKKAYRSKASQCHPDKGGSHEEFVAVQKAYEVLSDPESRQRYDSTGQSEKSQVPNPYELILQIFAQVAESQDETKVDLVKEVKNHLKQQKVGIRKRIRELRRNGRKWRNVGKRIKVAGFNPVANMARKNRETIIQEYIHLRVARRLVASSIELMKDWSYEFDKREVNEGKTLEELLMSHNARYFGINPL